ncbi:excalibur calcium-binding domain-containing protein [Flavobacterium sp. 270]|uniref:excalibur calcium-binding domain-containing protein n=1 Tax=Flavobacterium sp. 270 TaxID=2512114 RepID=UPI001065551F|nr:excalibur calcium-binding domain-containing protein [Flavobacterium sp. 270]TDW48739.1 excalibur calcium-binding domain-containing protein [Flavobacterium sp. 270]
MGHYRKGHYKKDGTYVQGHYVSGRIRSYSTKNNGCILIVLISILFAFSISCSDGSDSLTSDIVSSGSSSNTSSNNNCPTKTCGDFATRAQAQAAYNSNKTCYKNLDADGDGIACENSK